MLGVVSTTYTRSLDAELIFEFRAVFFLFTLWWARKNWLTWALIAGMTGLIVLFWFVAGGVALRYFVSFSLRCIFMHRAYSGFCQVLFVGVMNCMYALWDIVDDTISRKVNTSDATVFAKQFGCCPAQGKSDA